MTERPLDDPAFREMLFRASAILDQGYRDHAAMSELQAYAQRWKREVDAMSEELGTLRHDAETARAELVYWRSRAGLMLRALRKWQDYERALATPAAMPRALRSAMDATKEALAAISPAGIQ